MVTFTELRDAEPQKLTDAAAVWEQRAKVTGRRAEEMQTEVIASLKGWRGPASQAALKRLNKQVAELTEARKGMLGVSDILDQAGKTLAQAQADLHDAISYARGKGLTVEDDGSVSWLDWNPTEWAKDEDNADHAAGLIDDALRKANEADADAAGDLNAAQLVGQDRASLQALSMSEDPQVEKAVKRFHELMSNAGSFDLFGTNEMQKIAKTVEGLSPAEREAFLAQLSDKELKQWRGYMQGAGWSDGLPHWQRLDQDTALLGAVSGESVDRLTGVWPGLQPTPPDGSEYQQPGGPLDDGNKSWKDVNQGGVGDCWALSALAAEGHGNPDAYEDMVRQNSNGTVSVRMYDDSGNPHWVTVTGDLPVDENGSLAGVSGDSTNNSAATAENWPAYVEKALARAYEDGDGSTSGYEDINGDWPDQSVEALTGRPAHNIDASEANTTEIRQRVDSGETVIVSTAEDHTNDSGKLYGRHAYFVKNVQSDGDVVLGNPWGPGGTDSTVVLTQEEIHKYGTKVTLEGED